MDDGWNILNAVSFTVEVYSSFGQVPADVRSALEFPSVTDFFCSFGWFECLASDGGCEGTPRIYVARQLGGRVTAALFMMQRGRELSSLTNFYSVRFAPLVVPSNVAQEIRLESVSAIVRAIGAERPRWTRVEIRYLISSDAWLPHLSREFRTCGFYVTDFVQYENWHLRLTGETFEDYWRKRPSRLVNTVRRRRRKAESAHRLLWNVHSEPGDALDAAIERFHAVYSASWKQHEARPEFVAQMIRAAARAGTLKLGELLVDGVAAASQVWIVSDGRALIYKLAYDENFSDMSAGSLLSYTMFDGVFKDTSISEVDYGIGSEPYKREWMSAARLVKGIEAYSTRTLAGTLGACAHLAKRYAKVWRSRLFRRQVSVGAAAVYKESSQGGRAEEHFD